MGVLVFRAAPSDRFLEETDERPLLAQSST
jgi:hypothetical protein